MKLFRRSIATPREAKAMHSFGAGVTIEPKYNDRMSIGRRLYTAGARSRPD